MAGISSALYQGLFKRTSTFTLSIIVGAFFFERTFEIVSEGIYDNINQGKLWKHIKDKYA